MQNKTMNPNPTGGQAAENDQAADETHPIDDRYNFHDSSFRRHYQLNYGETGQPFEFYAPAYRFGYSLADENPGLEWEEMVDQAARHWQTRHDGSWHEMADAVHYGWREQRDPEELRVHHHGAT